MKKLLFLTLAFTLLAGTVMAQGTFYPGATSGGANSVHKIPIICPAEDDYVIELIGTVNDTSAVYVLPTFDELWVLTKTIPGSAHDSVKVVVFLEGKFTDELVTGYTSRSNGWVPIDSSLLDTPDSLGGRIKKLAVPPDVEQVRIIWDGITDNDGLTEGTEVSTWLLLKD